MNIFWIILIIIAAYFFVVFVLLRLVAPFMGFKQYRPPKDLPKDVRQTIVELENKSADQESYLRAVYDLVLDKTLHQWKHTRFKAAVRIPRVWVKDLAEIWETKDFVYCTAINFVIYTMLADSKFFTADDVKVRYVFVNFIIHQYLQVKVGDEWLDVDPAGAGIRGRPLGAHLSWFGRPLVTAINLVYS